ncbi:hypothetical protein OX89_08970 [Diaphorobacter sp. J5-51]|nr:hypothetical protein OX89_08970 [Diaphorobacter sp. J5-51]
MGFPMVQILFAGFFSLLSLPSAAILLWAAFIGFEDRSSEFLIVMAGFVFIISINAIFSLRKLIKFRSKSFAWYKAEHANHVSKNGVSCFSCGSSRIHARALMNHTYHREHFCSQCGKTLYYSPEEA